MSYTHLLFWETVRFLKFWTLVLIQSRKWDRLIHIFLNSIFSTRNSKIGKEDAQYFSHTLTAGWRPLSKRASFFIMFPTPGRTAWSSKISHNIRPFCFLISLSALNKLNFGEHISKSSRILIFFSHSAVFLRKIKCQKFSLALITSIIKYLYTVFNVNIHKIIHIK